MLNVCFSESARNLLKYSRILTPHVVCLIDDLSIGDITILNNYERRKTDIFKFLEDSDCSDTIFKKRYQEFLEEINKHTDIVIWYSDSPFEFCGMLYTLWLLRESSSRISTINCSQGLNCKSVGEIDPEKICSFLSYKQELNDEQRQIYAQLWENLMKENGQLRVLEESIVITVDISYYDEFILNQISDIPTKIENVIAQTLGVLSSKKNICISDSFIAFRIKTLIKDGVLKRIGNSERFYENRIVKV